jgi:hypothetical protein
MGPVPLNQLLPELLEAVNTNGSFRGVQSKGIFEPFTLWAFTGMRRADCFQGVVLYSCEFRPKLVL